MFKIKEISQKNEWDSFLNKEELEYFPFFQSWEYGEVQKQLGYKLYREGIYDKKNNLLGIFSIAHIKAKRGCYFHLRHGPVVLNPNESILKEILNYIKVLAKEKKASFIRISPLLKKEQENKNLFKRLKLIDSPMHSMDAETCLILDITKTEEELLRNMRKTHRYLIRKSTDMNIKIIRSKKLSDINKFLYLYRDLSKRKGFVPHGDVKEEFEAFSKNDKAILLFAQFEKKLIAAALIDFVGNMGIYHHGASLEAYRNIPASYLIQWEAILEAKKRGKKFYNFWGIVPLDKPNHPWKGLTLFKTGFGGERVEFVHAKDLPLNIFYWKTYLIETALRILKGY